MEIRDAKGAAMFRSVAHWDEKDTRVAIARIAQLAGLPDVNVLPEPQLERASDEKQQELDVRVCDERAASLIPPPGPRWRKRG